VRVQSHFAAALCVEDLYIDLSRRSRQPTALVFRHLRLRYPPPGPRMTKAVLVETKLGTKDKGDGRGESDGGGKSRNSGATR
jgi:hypothetical protein